MSSIKTAIGIDLGTVYSCVGVFQDDKVKILKNGRGHFMFPSCVAFTQSEVLVGDAAKDQISQNPQNTVYDVKRLIGLSFKDPFLQAQIKRLHYKVINCDSKPKIEVQYKSETKTFYPEEISSLILMQLKRTAELHLEKKVFDAVITVPAYFTDRQRQATKDACCLAGLNVLRIINEPTAAAIAAGLVKAGESEKRVLVFDLGGGTFSVSILNTDYGALEVMATGGDVHIGGVDFEQAMTTYFLADLKSRLKKDLTSDPVVVRRLMAACERAKIRLTTQEEAQVQLHTELERTITRAKFENICAPIFETLMQKVQLTLRDAKLEGADITDIVFVGGASCIPRIQQLMVQLCPKAVVCKEMHSEHAVAIGATIQAAMLSGVQSPSLSRMLILDVLPLSLGIEITGGQMDRLIKRNHTIPVTKTAVFSTNQDNQTTVTIKVFEGEYLMANDNHFLGLFEIHGIPKAKRGEPAIAVTFEVNQNGILSVTARDLNSDATNRIRVHYDKGSLEIGKKHDGQTKPIFSPVCSDQIGTQGALTAFASAIQKAVGEKSDTTLVPLELAMARRQCHLALMRLGTSSAEKNEKEKVEKELMRLENAFGSILTLPPE